MATEPVINRDAALARMGGDESLFNRLAEYFLVDAPALLQELDAAVSANDARRAHYVAHSLKGLAASFEAADVMAAARDVELLAQQDKSDGYEPAVEKLHSETAKVIEALRQMLAVQPSPA